MIIGIDASRANLQHKTGTEWYSFYLIKSLAAIDKKNTYWLYVNRPPVKELREAIQDNPNFSFRLLNWPVRYFWTLGRLTLEMLWRRPDVLFIPAHALPLFGPRKTINTIHDIAFSCEQNLYHSWKVRDIRPGSQRLLDLSVKSLTLGKYSSRSVDYLYWSTAFSLRHARKIIAVSEFTRREILDFYPHTPKDKIAVVHNGYVRELFRPINEPEKTQAVLRKYELPDLYFLYVGRLEKKKNVSALVEALAILRDHHPEIKAKLVLIGDAGFGFDEIEYSIEEFNLNDEVIMPGWVSEADLPYIFNAASAFIFPSKHEGFGLPVVQAMACGVPAAVSDLPVLREIAGEGVLYFNQHDKYAIATAMRRIVSEAELRRRLITKGLERAKAFSWEKCARETLKEIETC